MIRKLFILFWLLCIPFLVFAAGNDANTMTLLHCDGTDGSTSVPDTAVGGTGHTWTCQNDAQLDTAQKKFGSASLYLDGTDYINTPDSSDYDFGTGAFTIDFWVRFEADPAGKKFYSVGLYTEGPAVLLSATDEFRFYIDESSGYDKFQWSPNTNEWYHIACVRDASQNTYVFIGGVEKVSGTDSANINISANTTIGRWTGIADYIQGWVDEFRISNVARWTSNFTPPTEPYSADVDGQVMAVT